ncbi:MAG: imidazole glycerol phosphate synthase subunit HisH [Lachnospiraceae bacterium]|nr:imidazole glycerol phosphate synthase subunit HisH [Lachnospiraceae bacterium]
METAIIDYGMGNLLSVQRAFEKCGSEAAIIDNPLELRNAERIVLPGVGAFPDAMNNLEKGNWIEELNRAVLQKGTPILGICLGMQLLAAKGYEGQECLGLGYIPGEVVLLDAKEEGERIPHVGWNEIEGITDTELLAGIPAGTNFYFVHSYHFRVKNQEDIICYTPYCGGFVSAIGRGHIVGTQFHPEKSQKAGFRVIKNFLKM